MSLYLIGQRPNNLIRHRYSSKNNVIVRLPQHGSGLGSILRSFFRWIVPVSKSALSTGKDILKSAAKSKLAKDTASALRQEATTAGINVLQSALKGDNIKEATNVQTKSAANKIGKSVSQSLEQYRPANLMKQQDNLIKKDNPIKKLKKKPAPGKLIVPKKKFKFKDNLS